MSIPRLLLFDTTLGEARASVTNREAAAAAIGGHGVKKRKIQPGILTSNVPVESSPLNPRSKVVLMMSKTMTTSMTERTSLWSDRRDFEDLCEKLEVISAYK